MNKHVLYYCISIISFLFLQSYAFGSCNNSIDFNFDYDIDYELQEPFDTYISNAEFEIDFQESFPNLLDCVPQESYTELFPNNLPQDAPIFSQTVVSIEQKTLHPHYQINPEYIVPEHAIPYKRIPLITSAMPGQTEAFTYITKKNTSRGTKESKKNTIKKIEIIDLKLKYNNDKSHGVQLRHYFGIKKTTNNGMTRAIQKTFEQLFPNENLENKISQTSIFRTLAKKLDMPSSPRWPVYKRALEELKARDANTQEKKRPHPNGSIPGVKKKRRLK